MTLLQYIDVLPEKVQFKLAIKLARLALPVWENYYGQNDLVYRDTVVGLTHTVDPSLLRCSIDTVERFLNGGDYPSLLKLASEFAEPIVALQDLDWELPDSVESYFFSVYNLLGAATGKEYTSSGTPTIYISINQSIDALLSSGVLATEDIREILYGLL